MFRFSDVYVKVSLQLPKGLILVHGTTYFIICSESSTKYLMQPQIKKKIGHNASIIYFLRLKPSTKGEKSVLLGFSNDTKK
jgi:hypothetical protein